MNHACQMLIFLGGWNIQIIVTVTYQPVTHTGAMDGVNNTMEYFTCVPFLLNVNFCGLSQSIMGK